MNRTTTPDKWSRPIKFMYRDLRAGRISRTNFATVIALIWNLRRSKP